MQVETVLLALGVGSISGLVVSFCVLFFAKSYFSSYLSAKGTNLATKEDVAGITKLVEEVKYRFSTDLEDHRTKNLMRMAALDRRLQAHQEAFSLWRKLFTSVHTKDVGSVVSECQDWWTNNCLYLEPEARDAFNNAYFSAHNHASLLQNKDVENIEYIKKNFAVIKEAGDVLLNAAKLPPLTQRELQQLDEVSGDEHVP